jgi:alpha-L-fucosidase
MPWGDVTVQGGTLLLSVFDWPQDGRLLLPGLKTEIASAQMLGKAGSNPVSHRRQGDWTVLEVPPSPQDRPASVVALKLAGPADVDGTHGIYPNIDVTLLAEFAEVSGAEKKRLGWMEKFGEWKFATQVGQWTNGGKAVWTVDVFEPGLYHVALTYRGEGRVVWSVETEGARIQNQQGATRVYHSYPIGVLPFNTPGRRTVTVSLIEGDREQASLEAIRFRRAD